MMIVMDQAIPRGSLLVNGRQIDSKKLAGVVGVDRKQAEELLAELEEAGVFSRDGDGTIFSRKMRRDEARAERDKANGKGGGNPQLIPKEHPPDNHSPSGGVNPRVGKPDKAKNLELRSQKEAALLSAEAASERDEKPETLEQKCRKIVGEEPVSIDHNFVILGDLVGKDGIVEDDVIDGILAAMEDRSFRIKYWKQLMGWARTAARKRLSDAAKRVSPTTIAVAGVEEPAVDLGLGLTAESMVVKIIEKHAQAPYAHWIETQFGDTKTFRRRVEERASHLMKFWPEEPLRAAQ